MSATPVLEVVPRSCLVFEKNLRTGTVLAPLTLNNVSEECVAYKIKTTAPKVYIVKPNSGVIEPDGVGNVQVEVHPLADGGNRQGDRFLVQSIPVESKSVGPDFWQSVSKQKLHEIRLSVKFEDVDGNTHPTTAGTGTGPNTESRGISKAHNSVNSNDPNCASVEDTNLKLKKEIEELKKKIEHLDTPKHFHVIGEEGKSLKSTIRKELSFTEAVLIVAVAIIVLGYLKLI